MLKEPDSRGESSISVLNFENVDTNVCASAEDRNGSECYSDVCQTSNFETEVKTAEKWTVPEGYIFLPEKFFRLKNIPPPLVSLSWFKRVSSDEEPGEDSIPLAKLKKLIKKKKQTNSRRRKEKEKSIKQPAENAILRKRGRPKKEAFKAPLSETFENATEDSFWNSLSDASNLDTQDALEFPFENPASVNTFSINYNEHDYFKPVDSTSTEESLTQESNEKQKKKKSAVQGVTVGDSKMSFPCFECGKSFSAASTLKSHQRIHNGTLLICPECHKGFVSKYLLKCHMRIHNGDLFMCHKCGRGFTTAELLKVHSRAHTGDRPFMCKICGKSFPTSSNMIQHTQIHNSEKKFLCSQCGSSFVQKRCLDYHMLTHSEKKNICNVCGKLWARKSDLIEHMRVHTGVKPYCCTLCPQKFSQASSLKRHQLVHLDAKPISCAICNKMFKCQEYYKRHLRKHEKEDFLLHDT